jgi:hypothetical protein
MTIVTQTNIGEIGEKATTTLSSSFCGFANCKNHQYGINSNGIYRLNYGDTEILKTITFATTDCGIKNNKRFRYLYLQVETYDAASFTVSIMSNNDQVWMTKTVDVANAGLQMLRFTIDRLHGNGFYHTIEIKSYDQFKIHSMSGLVVVRPKGIKGD